MPSRGMISRTTQNQARASARKRANQRANQAALVAEAEDQGITVSQLRVRRLKERDEAILHGLLVAETERRYHSYHGYW